jgi:hypothetical protein
MKAKSQSNFPIFVHSKIDDFGFTPEEFRILGRVARRWNQAVGCIESTRRMAKGCGMSDRTVRNCLFVLTAANVLHRTERGPKISPRYDLMPFEAWAEPSLLPEFRKCVRAYRSDRMQSTASVQNAGACGSKDRTDAVVETHEGSPNKAFQEVNPKGSRSSGNSHRQQKKPHLQDARSIHPAILAVKNLIGKHPNKLVWDDLITLLGEDFDQERLRACARAWATVSANMHNLAWIFEWYVHGIPERVKGSRNASTNQDSRVSNRNSRKTSTESAATTSDQASDHSFGIIEPGWFQDRCMSGSL